MSGFGFSSWNESFSFSKPEKSEREATTRPKQARRANAVVDQGPKQIVTPLTEGQFPPFTHFFVVVKRANNLHGCDGQSLFVRIRVHPSIPVVETPSVWCEMRDVNFDMSYAFDFTQVPPFNLSDFTPVIEFYKKSTKPELLSVVPLPLKIGSIVELDKKALTYFYRDKSLVLRGLVNGNKLGSLLITLAMGFSTHKRWLDTNVSEIVTTQKLIPDVPVRSINEPLPSPPKPEPKKAVKPRAEKREDYYDDEELPKRKKMTHHSTKKADDYSWVNEAMRLGWKPPGSTDFDWKGKARQKGWKPPHDQIYSSTGVTCDPNARGLRRVADIQTDPEKPPQFSEKELLRMLHEKRKSKKKSLKIEPSIVFETPFETPRLEVKPCLTLISEAPMQTAVLDEDVSSSEQQDIHGEIQDLLNVTSRNLKSFRISSDENSEYEEEEESDCGFFKQHESDGASFLKRLAINDPQLMKMMDLM